MKETIIASLKHTPLCVLLLLNMFIVILSAISLRDLADTSIHWGSEAYMGDYKSPLNHFVTMSLNIIFFVGIIAFAHKMYPKSLGMATFVLGYPLLWGLFLTGVY